MVIDGTPRDPGANLFVETLHQLPGVRHVFVVGADRLDLLDEYLCEVRAENRQHEAIRALEGRVSTSKGCFFLDDLSAFAPEGMSRNDVERLFHTICDGHGPEGSDTITLTYGPDNHLPGIQIASFLKMMSSGVILDNSIPGGHDLLWQFYYALVKVYGTTQV